MPLVTVHLLALAPGVSISDFLRAIKSQSIKPLVISKAIRWVVRPEKLSASRLLNTEWDLLIILPLTSPLPPTNLSRDWLSDHWTITAGVPGSLLKDFEARNQRLLHPRPNDVPALTAPPSSLRAAGSTQNLELDRELLEWSRTTSPLGGGAVSMLNLLAFRPGAAAHASYLRYGKAFAESIGARRGGTAKIVGKVVAHQRTPGEDGAGWGEIALAHYPSLNHFMDMIDSEDYQEVNHRHRLPALEDTCILCTSELAPEVASDKAKL